MVNPELGAGLLGPAQVRSLAAELGLRPSKQRGQNFVHDPNTVRRILRLSGVNADDVVLEVGPGLGSLTLALLPAVAKVVAVELDALLAKRLPLTVAAQAPAFTERLMVLTADALTVQVGELGPQPPTALVANLPYNVSVPVLLHLLAQVPTLRHGLVMVQEEVARRLVAGPGESAYGVPSVKLAWYAESRYAGAVPRAVFWPVPNVDSGLIDFIVRASPPSSVPRAEVFACVDAAFSQRRKTLRGALAQWAGSPDLAEQYCRDAGIDPGLRGERLGVASFVALAEARSGFKVNT